MDYWYQFVFYSMAVYGKVCIYDDALWDPVTMGEYMKANGVKYDRSKFKSWERQQKDMKIFEQIQ